MHARGNIWRLLLTIELRDDGRMSQFPSTNNDRSERLKRLFPGLSGDQLTDMETRLKQYVSIVLRVMDYVETKSTVHPHPDALQSGKPDLRSDPGAFDL